MTERLSQLLQTEAANLRIPPPPSAEVLETGHRVRARHRAVTGAAAAAALLVIGGTTAGLWLTTGHDATQGGVAAETASPPAFGIGPTVFVGDLVASVPGSVHSLSYTSVGVLVRSNAHEGASDGSGPESLTLVGYDGTTHSLGTIPEGVGPATDPTQPYYALAKRAGDGFVAVVRDAETGAEVATVPLPKRPMSYWPVPPLALSGDNLFVGYRHTVEVVDWHTGDVKTAPDLSGGFPEVSGGRTVLPGQGGFRVVDAATGDELATIPFPERSTEDPAGSYGRGVTLSPDGRFALTFYSGQNDVQVYDIATGADVTFTPPDEYPEDPLDFGWTADGNVFWVQGSTVTTCDSQQGTCTDSPTTARVRPDTDVRPGGVMFES
ncbi:MAG: hypothetical protein QM714_00820 [Nocardioides sp.]|uniref:YncE family protein n=1 Tax=Nocardioides sp. TaxID=35761 RepID=UPI0039E392BA